MFAAAYYRAEKRTCHKTNETKDFTDKKPEVIYAECILPADAPEWAIKLRQSMVQDENGHYVYDETGRNFSETAWNLIENMEKRYDAQLYVRENVALPFELNQDEAIDLVKDFVKNELAVNGVFCEVAIHWDLNNPHFHMMRPAFRALTEEGFSKKVRISPAALKENLQHLRKSWEEYANRKLKQCGHDVRIDHRSYKDRGLDLTPTVHVGKATHMTGTEHQALRIAENQRIRAENYQKLQETPEIMSVKMAQERHVFTSQDVKNEVSKYVVNEQVLDTLRQSPDGSNEKLVRDILTVLQNKRAIFSERELKEEVLSWVDNDKTFNNVIAKIAEHKDVYNLGLGDDGRTHYVTKAAFMLEAGLGGMGESLAKSSRFKVDAAIVRRVAKKYGLTDSQKVALKHITQKTDLGLVRGVAGSGKTYMLKAANEVWQEAGYRVRGVGFTGRTASALEDDANIRSYTIETFMKLVDEKKFNLGKKDILVMDEAGMTSLDDMHRILKVAHDHKLKFCAVGDQEQTESVGRGSAWRAVLEQFGFVEMTDIVRQKVSWQREASMALEGNTPEKGLDAYHEHGNIHFTDTSKEAVEQLVALWFAEYNHQRAKEYILSAHKNESVQALNQLARQRLINAGVLKEGELFSTQTGEHRFSVGDRIVFGRNSSKLGVSSNTQRGVKNGHFGVIKQIKGQQFTVELDSGKSVRFSLTDYNYIEHGYAATIHKLQGYTGDKNFNYFDGYGWDKNKLVVGGTRHRYDLQMVADREHFEDYSDLREAVCRSAPKDHILEYPTSFAIRRGFDEQTIAQNTVSFVRRSADKVHDAWLYLANYQGYIEKQAAVKQIKVDAEREWLRQKAVTVADFTDYRIEIAKKVEELKTLPGHDIVIHYQKKPDDDQVDAKKLYFYHDGNTIRYAVRVGDDQVVHRVLSEIGVIDEKLEANLNHVFLDENEYLRFSKQDKEALYKITEKQGYFAVDEEKRVALSRAIYHDQLKNADRAEIIQADYDQYKRAMAYNRIRTSAVEKSVAFKERHDEIRGFADEFRLGQFYNITASDKIDREMGLYRGHIISAFGDNDDKKAFENAVKQQAYQHRYHTAIETFEASQHERVNQFKEYLDLGCHAGETMRSLKQDEAIDQATAKAQMELIYEKRDELAYQLTQSESFEELAEHFGVKTNQIYHHKTQHLARATVKEFAALLKAGETISSRQLQLLARTIKLRSKLYGPYVKVYIKDGWKNVNLSHWRLESDRAVLGKSREFKDGHNLVRRYFDLSNEASAAWKSAMKRRDKQYNQSPNFQTHLQRAQALSYRRDQVASEIIRDTEAYAGVLGFERVDLNTLNARARSFDYFNLYLKETNEPKKLKMAHYIHSHMKSFGHAVGHNQLFDEIKTSAHHYRYLQMVHAAPDNSVKGAIRHLEHYDQKRIEANRAWRDYKLLEKQGRPAEYELQAAKHLLIQRNQSAFDLVQYCANQNLIEPYIEGFKLDVNKLEKASEQHIIYQRVLGYLNTDANDRGQLAHELLSDKTGYHFIYDHGIEFKQLRLEANAWLSQHQQAQSTVTTVHQKRWDVELINQALMANPEDTYTAIFGEPKKRTGREWRYGAGLVVTVKGSGAGKWFSFTEGQGGGPIKAIEYQMGLSFKDALKQGAAIAGLTEAQAMTIESQERLQKRVETARERQTTREALEKQQRIESAQSIWNGTVPAAGTLAERYFTEHRKVADIDGLAIRYWPAGSSWVNYDASGRQVKTNNVPAVVIPVYNLAGEINGVQRIYLDKNTAGKATFMDDPKLSKGVTKGLAGVIRQGEAGGRMYIAEGPETAASIALADKQATVLVSLSANNLANMADIVRSYNPSEVILAADNDGYGSNSHKATKAAFERLKQGLMDTPTQFKLIYPKNMSGMDKVDWNDVLVKLGQAALATQLKEASGRLDNEHLYYHSAQPIAYTPAEHYLREVKGLAGADLSLARYHPSVQLADGKASQSAILVPAINEHNEISAELILYLDEEGSRVTHSLVNGDAAGSAVVLKHNADASSTYITNNFVDAASITIANKKTNVYVSLGNYGDLSQLTWLFDNKGRTINLTTNQFSDRSEKALYEAAQPLVEQGYHVQMAKGRLSGDYSKVSINDALLRQDKVRGDSFIQQKAIQAPEPEKRSLKDRLSRKGRVAPAEVPKAKLSPAEPSSYYMALSDHQRDTVKGYIDAVAAFNEQDSFEASLEVAKHANAVYEALDHELERIRLHPQRIQVFGEPFDFADVEQRVVQGKTLGLHDMSHLLETVAEPKLDTETFNQFKALSECMAEHRYDENYNKLAEVFLTEKQALIDAWKQNDNMPGDGIGYVVDQVASLDQDHVDRSAWLGVGKLLTESVKEKQRQRQKDQSIKLDDEEDRSRGGRSY